MAWGGLGIKSLVHYVSFKTVIDGPSFVRILEDHLIHDARKKFGWWWHLQLDNDPKPTSRVAKQFFNKEVLEVLDWPLNSPDVNRIENLCSIIKRRFEKRKAPNLEELDTFLHEEWKNIDPIIRPHLGNSMKSRFLAFIESKGERINY